jgi:hypothetical protein
MPDPKWLPALLLFTDFYGDWVKYMEAAYMVFRRDFIESQPMFHRQHWVRCRRDPICEGKEAGFWHCISTGPDELNRIPEIRRIECIRWIRAIIENVEDASVVFWVRHNGNEPRWHLCFNEEHLVVLGERKGRNGLTYFQLITAFDTLLEHQKRKRRREREEWQRLNG